ncbi:hypothetical protein PIROE2DRAFT_13024 [Piromyces sp. E2]|nr:hypothetical protein PIROE2DRAFT_13024 [Piromyces sp. E2]|eukprot:OUM61070.1 hypothetical protein PIROE2DRAFT_13024 [Piromyces sp. E2]
MRILGEAKLAINNLYERAESRNKQNNKYIFQKPINPPSGKRTKSNNSTVNKNGNTNSSSGQNQNNININALLHNEFVLSSLFKASTSFLDDSIGDSRTRSIAILKKNDNNVDSIGEIKDKLNNESNLNIENQNNVNNNSGNTINNANTNTANNNSLNISNNNTNIENYTYNMKLLYEKLAIIQTRVVDLQYVIQKVEETLQQEKKQEQKKVN